MNEPNPLRKIIRWGIIAVAALLVLYLLVYFLTSGTVTVNTSDASNSINVSVLGAEEKLAKPVKAQHKTFRLKAGDYSVVVSNGSNKSAQAIKVSALKKQEITLNPAAALAVEPVISRDAGSINPRQSSLKFLDLGLSTVINIGNNNSFTAPYKGVELSQVAWAGDTGAARDPKGQLITINNNSARPTGIFGVDDVGASTNGNAYYTKGKDLFLFKPTGDGTKIYSSDEQDFSFYNGLNKVVITEGGGNKGKSSSNTVKLIDQTGAVSKHSVAQGYFSWAGEDKAVFAGGANYSQLLSGSLDPQAKIYGQSRVAAWLGDDVYYGVADELWKYSTTTSQSSLIANMPFSDKILEIAPEPGGKSIYLITQAGSGDTEIKRVNLTGKAVSDNLSKLQSVLPLELPFCNVSLLNYAAPAILMSPTSDMPISYCQNQALTEFQDRGINAAGLQFTPEESIPRE